MLQHVIGQDIAKHYLIGSHRQKRLAHAYLLSGAEGWGAEELALEFARYLLCDRPDTQNAEYCGACRSCLQSKKFQHPDMHYYFPVLKSLNEDEIRELIEEKISDLYVPLKVTGGSIHIGDPENPEEKSIRSLIRESSVRSFTGKIKIFIITFADAMNAEAANAFLKILEEPPPQTLFFLTTSQPNALLPTIISRCQIVRLTQLAESEIVDVLTAKGGLAEEQAVLLARLSEGNYARAVQMQRGNLEPIRDWMLNFLLAAVSSRPADLPEFLDKLIREYGKDKTTAVTILQLMLTWFQDTAALINCGKDKSAVLSRITNIDKAERLQKFAGRFPGIPLAEIAGEIEKAVELILRNVYLPLVFTQLGLSLRKRIMEPDSGQY